MMQKETKLAIEMTDEPGETVFPDVQPGDFVRVGALPGIVTRVYRDNPLDIRCDVLCWTGRETETFARIPWTGSGEVPAWDWVGRIPVS